MKNRTISIELLGGPWDGRRCDNIPIPIWPPHGTWDDGWHYTYTPAGHRTTEGRYVYHLTHAIPANDHHSMQGGDL